MMALLEARKMTVGVAGKAIIRQLDLAIPAGRRTAIIGPNGSGKSTLLKGIAGLWPLEAGGVFLDGRDIKKIGKRELSRQLAVLPQAPQAPADLTVRDLVEHGRFPHRGRWTGADRDAGACIKAALRQTHMEALQDRLVATLSGGERQRAWIAMALAQKPRLLLLDEPTTYLDICHQLEVMQLLTALHEASGMTVAMVLHDINHASQFADHVVVLKEGRVAAAGAPADVITAALLREVFQVEAEVFTGRSGNAVFLPTRLSAERGA